MNKTVKIRTNFFYSSFITVANYLFTFITYPYVSRVLGVDKIGAVNFVDSVVNYFIMLSMMGIGIIGIREVAKFKQDKNSLNSTFSNLFVINISLTSIALCILAFVYLLSPELQSHSELLCVGVLKLIANIFLMDWFFKGMEDFKIITIRTFVVRILYVIAVFSFIHTPDDYIAYFLLTSIAVILNATFNCLYMRHLVSLKLNELEIKKYITPVIILGLYMFFGNFYSSFNTMFLGIKCGDTEVGYFSTATKLFAIILSIFSAFTTVMMPRMSSLLQEGKTDEFKSLLNKSITIVFSFCTPMVILTMIQSPNIIRLLAGEGYDGAILPMQISMPLLLIIGYNQILHNQCLMPLGKDKAILITTIIGGICALFLCILLIPYLGSKGSSILWVCSEISVCAVSSYFVYLYIDVRFPLSKLFKSIYIHIPLLLLLHFTCKITNNVIVDLSLASVMTFIYCFITQCYIIKEPTIKTIFKLQ